VEQSAKYINKMQKTLRLMNIRLDVAIRDLTGKSGRAILDAILAGHRDPDYLASLAHFRIKRLPRKLLLLFMETGGTIFFLN